MTFPNLAGQWIFHGHPWDAPHRGRIAIELIQNGLTLRGELVQEIGPGSGAPPADPEQTRADVEGELVPHPDGGHPLVILKRLNRQSAFRAVFVGAFDETQQTISGTFKNNAPGGGTFVMERAGSAPQAGRPAT